MLCRWTKTATGYLCESCGFVTPIVMYRNCGPEVDPRESLREMRRRAGINDPPPPEPLRPVYQCPHLGDMLAADDAGTIAREAVPCTRCGHKDGRKEYAIHECTAPDNEAGECIPFYDPTPQNFVDYEAGGFRPRVCRRCPHFANATAEHGPQI